MRDLDPVFQAALDALEPILFASGLKLASEWHSPEAFGSAETEYARRGLRVRLTWDGKDRWLWVQYARPEGNAMARREAYRDLEAERNDLPTYSPRLTGAIADERIRQLADRLTTFLDRGHAG